MQVDDKTGLIQFLAELKPSKKRNILQVPPADEGRQPLVEIRPRSPICPANQGDDPGRQEVSTRFVAHGTTGGHGGAGSADVNTGYGPIVG